MSGVPYPPEGVLVAALGQVTDAVLITDLDGVIRSVNAAFTAMSGYGAEEVIGATSLLDADAQDGTSPEQVWATVRSGESWQGASVKRHRSGRPYTVAETITPVAAGGTALTHVVVVRTDVTARQEAEQQRDLYAQLLSVAGAAVIRTDLDGTVTFWNHAAEQLYGWSAEEVTGRSILTVNVHPEAAEHAEWIMSQLRAGRNWTGEFEAHRRDGVRIPTLVTNAPYHDASGQLAGIIGVSVGVAELRQAQRQAQQRASQQAAVAELGRQALSDLDLERITEQVVQVVATELEVPLVKVLTCTEDGGQLLVTAGSGWQDGVVGHALVANDAGSQAGFTLLQQQAVITHDLATERRFHGPDLLTAHGVVSGMSTPIRGLEGDDGILAVHTTGARDFTADEASFLDAVAGVLGAAVARERVEQQLREVVDRLARSDEIRLAFLRATSHELRTPLAVIVGLAETLQSRDAEVEDGRRGQLLARLTANAARLARLIDDLLDVDRLASGLVTASRHPQQLGELIERVVSEQDLGGRRLELDLEPVVAEVDAPKLERVVANLLANAVRYTPDDATIRIGLHRRGGDAVLFVEDDGEGVDPDELEQIFEPFVQGPAQRHAAQPGTGLGLTLARELVALHDGTLTAGNRPEGGARFEVVLPDPVDPRPCRPPTPLNPMGVDHRGAVMAAQRMTAAVLTGHGGPEMLEIRDDVAVPQPGAGEVLVEVAAAAVNNTDIWTREGAYGREDDPDAVVGWKGEPLDFPRIQGGDVVGVVVAGGEGVDDALIGRRVLIDPTSYADDGDEPTLTAVLGSEHDGGFAGYVVVAADQAYDVTDAPLSDTQLACLPIAYGTATGMLERAELRADETVLVTGASGGVGLALVQLARARGARVIALTSEDHAAAVAAAGAARTVPRDAAEVVDRLRDAAGGSVDVVADVVGGWVFRELFPLLGTGGRWVTCGAVAGPVVDLDLRTLYLQRRRLIGSTMHTPAQFRRLVDDARQGRLDPQVARTYPLTEIHAAQADFATGDDVGKLVLLPR